MVFNPSTRLQAGYSRKPGSIPLMTSAAMVLTICMINGSLTSTIFQLNTGVLSMSRDDRKYKYIYVSWKKNTARKGSMSSPGTGPSLALHPAVEHTGIFVSIVMLDNTRRLRSAVFHFGTIPDTKKRQMLLIDVQWHPNTNTRAELTWNTCVMWEKH